MQFTIVRRSGERVTVTVDDEDYARVMAFGGWTANERGYVSSNVKLGRHWEKGDPPPVRLHRFVLGLGAGNRPEVDHKNGDHGDCRKENLRVGSHAENMQNMATVNNRGTSRFRGVSWNSQGQKWRATVRHLDKLVHLGTFDSEDAAAEVLVNWRTENLPFANAR